MAITNFFFALPLACRAGIVLGLVLLFFLLLHTPILKTLSVIPFLLKQVFRVFYLLLEWPVSALHKSLGGVIYRIDNGLAACSEKIDAWLERWYTAWHIPKPREKYVAVTVVVFVVCYLSIIAPTVFHVENDNWKAKGGTIYLHMEGALTDFLEEHGWYRSDIPDATSLIEEPEEPWENQDTVQIPLTVFRVSSELPIVDIPSATDYTTLDTVKNGDVVIWNGALTFDFTDGQQNAWVKVTTESGVEGWGYLYFLHPEEGTELTLMLTEASKTAVSAPPA